MGLVDLLHSSKVVRYGKGEVISDTTEDKMLWQVKAGFIKRYQITNAGFISIQSIYGPTDIFPLTYVYKVIYDKEIYGGPDTFYYEAVANSELWALPMTTLVEATQKDPLLFRDLLGVAGDRFFSNIQQLENLSLATAEKRVAHQLLYLAHKWGRQRGATIEIQVPLTQQDIADFLSLTRETVSSCINKLKKRRSTQKNQSGAYNRRHSPLPRRSLQLAAVL